jgi:hypothetical protein
MIILVLTRVDSSSEGIHGNRSLLNIYRAKQILKKH